MTCDRCKGNGFIRRCELRVDDVPRGEPQTATVTVTKVFPPEECPDCGGSGCCPPATRKPNVRDISESR